MPTSETAPISEELSDYQSTDDQDPTPFGPTIGDLDTYQALLDHIRDHGTDGLTWDPRNNAELVSILIDGKQLGIFIGENLGSEVEIDDSSKFRLAQQRYIAAALGLRVEPTAFHFGSQTATADISLPNAAEIPPRPTKNAAGELVDAAGIVLSKIQVDAIHAAHFISTHKNHFSTPGVFEELFSAIVRQAEKGELTFGPKGGEFSKDYASLARQIARILGYKVGKFSKGKQSDTYTMPIKGKRSGFNSRFTHFLSPNEN